MGVHREKGSRKKKWRVDYYVYESGKRLRRKKYFQHKVAAEDFDRKEAIKDERRRNGLSYSEEKKVIDAINEFVVRQLDGRSPDYVRVAKQRLFDVFAPYFVGRSVHEISQREIEDFLRDIAKDHNYAGTTVHHFYTLLKTFFSRMIDWHYAEIHPMAKLAKPKKVPKRSPSAKTELELRRFFNVCEDEILFPALILLHTGVRISELMMLEKADFDLEHSVLRIRNFEGHTTKSNRSRALRISPVVQEIILRMTDGPVVRMARKTFEKRFLKAARRAKVSITPHELRHSCATLMMTKGLPLKVVEDYLGHESTIMTKHYTSYMPGQGDEAIAKMTFGLDMLRDNTGTAVIKLVGNSRTHRDD